MLESARCGGGGCGDGGPEKAGGAKVVVVTVDVVVCSTRVFRTDIKKRVFLYREKGFYGPDPNSVRGRKSDLPTACRMRSPSGWLPPGGNGTRRSWCGCCSLLCKNFPLLVFFLCGKICRLVGLHLLLSLRERNLALLSSVYQSPTFRLPTVAAVMTLE